MTKMMAPLYRHGLTTSTIRMQACMSAMTGLTCLGDLHTYMYVNPDLCNKDLFYLIIF